MCKNCLFVSLFVGLFVGFFLLFLYVDSNKEMEKREDGNVFE